MNVTATHIAARVAARRLEAFQFAYAQAFADQVGMPERMTVRKLHVFLVDQIAGALRSADWELQDSQIESHTWHETEYGPARSYYEYRGGPKISPDERDTTEIKYPSEYALEFTTTVRMRDLVRQIALARPPFPTQFFRLNARAILAFLTNPRNAPLAKRFFAMALSTDHVDGSDWDTPAYDQIRESFDENVENGTASFAGAEYTVNGLEVEYDLTGFWARAKVTAEVDATDFDAEVEGPDPDEYDDRY